MTGGRTDGEPGPAAPAVPTAPAVLTAPAVPVGPFAGHEGPGFPDVPRAVAGTGGPRRRPRRRTGALLAGGTAAVLLVGVGSGYAGAQLHGNLDQPAPVGVGSPLTEPPSTGSTAAAAGGTSGGATGAAAAGPAPDVRGVAASALPSVVAVQVTTADGGDSGSGFVIRSDGLILTNDHVIAGATAARGSISVVFADGTSADAAVVGRTTPYDLAVLRVRRSGLAPLRSPTPPGWSWATRSWPSAHRWACRAP